MVYIRLLEIILAERTTEHVLLFHKKITKLVFLWPNMDQKSLRVLIFTILMQGKTCPPAMGYSFAAGTTDGPGAFDFTQGMTEGNPFWNMVIDFIHEPEPEQVACHAPKPILLDTGYVSVIVS